MISERASQRVFFCEIVLLAAPTLLFGVVASTVMTVSPIENLLMRDPDQPLYGLPIIALGVLGLAACGSALYLMISFLTGGVARLKRTSWIWWVPIAGVFGVSGYIVEKTLGLHWAVRDASFGELVFIGTMSGLLGVIPYLHLLAERLFRSNSRAQI